MRRFFGGPDAGGDFESELSSFEGVVLPSAYLGGGFRLRGIFALSSDFIVRDDYRGTSRTTDKAFSHLLLPVCSVVPADSFEGGGLLADSFEEGLFE